jgi:hypothetical protein
MRTLIELQGEDPMILTLARSHYGPQGRLAAPGARRVLSEDRRGLQADRNDCDRRPSHHTLQEFRASVGAQWTFLSDAERRVQKDLDTREYTDPEHNLMIPHTLVLRSGLVIHSIYNGLLVLGPTVDHRSLA